MCSVDPTRRRKETPNVHARTLGQMRFLQETPDDFRAGIGVLQVRHASDSQYAAEFAAADIVLLSNGASRFWGSRIQREKKEERR